MSNYEDVYAPDLTEETESTLSGSEQFVMFDSVEGKRAELSTIADYIVENGEIDGSDIPTIVSTIEGNIGTLDTKVGDLTDLDTTDKTSAVGAINEVYGDLSDKADQNGVYPDLSAGNITGDFHIDTKPYLYRALRDVASHIGSKAFDTLVGGSVAVNQLVNTGTTSVTIPSGHKYYSNINNIKAIGASTGAAIAINDDTKDNVIDLTQLFASDPSIADRAYTLEQNQAGSGIAWLKSYGFFTKPYYAYNAGTLQSTKASKHKMVGFNQWDEEWENGRINATTGADASGNGIRCKNMIKVIPNTMYHVVRGSYADASSIIIFYYDGNENYISYNNMFGLYGSFTTPANACYIRFNIQTSSAITTYNHDICINLSKTTGTPKNGDYLPYESVTYQISPEELRGTLKLVNNEIQYNGDIRYADGTLGRNYEKITLAGGDYSIWAVTNTLTNCVQFAMTPSVLAKATNASVVGNAISDRFITGSGESIYANDKEGLSTDTLGRIRITILKSRIDPVNAIGLDAWLQSNNVTVIYEKATPTTETSDPFTSPQQVFADGTEEYIDTRTVPIPVGHETKYELDLAEKLIELPWDLSMLAPIENGTTASQAYAAGKYFVRNNEFCKAKTSIASGATFTLGTNYEVTTVGAELYALA